MPRSPTKITRPQPKRSVTKATAAGQRPIDPLLAGKKPIHGPEELRLPNLAERKLLGKRRLGEAPGAREL